MKYLVNRIVVFLVCATFFSCTENCENLQVTEMVEVKWVACGHWNDGGDCFLLGEELNGDDAWLITKQNLLSHNQDPIYISGLSSDFCQTELYESRLLEFDSVFVHPSSNFLTVKLNGQVSSIFLPGDIIYKTN